MVQRGARLHGQFGLASLDEEVLSCLSGVTRPVHSASR